MEMETYLTGPCGYKAKTKKGNEVIFIYNSFSIKEELKKDGFKFGEAPLEQILGEGIVKGWYKIYKPGNAPKTILSVKINASKFTIEQIYKGSWREVFNGF
jgi:hypothetical protein